MCCLGRPPQNRDPKPDEIAMMKAVSLQRHIAFASQRLLVIVGNWSSAGVAGQNVELTSIARQWTQAEGLPALPMFHPA